MIFVLPMDILARIKSQDVVGYLSSMHEKLSEKLLFIPLEFVIVEFQRYGTAALLTR